MKPDQFALFVMIDDSDNELFLTKSIFRHHYPHTEFICEQSPKKALDLIAVRVQAGLNASKIVVLLDIKMPKVNGFEVIYTIRNNIETFRTCVLMLSASRHSADRADATAIGANGYLQKPFTILKLDAALAQIVDDEAPPVAAENLLVRPVGGSIPVFSGPSDAARVERADEAFGR